MGNTTSHTISDLGIALWISPFTDYFGAIIDFWGEWTEELVVAFEVRAEEDTPPRLGMWVWVGTCTIQTAVDVDGEVEDVEHKFIGEHRRMHQYDAARIGDGYFPLRGTVFPLADAMESLPSGSARGA